MDTMLSANNISKAFDEKKVLENVSLHLDAKEVVCVLGVSGVGKTTLFHILSGLSLPDKGNVLLNGNDVTGRPGKISYMLQKDLLLPYKRIADNVAMPLKLRGRKSKEARAEAVKYFPEFGLTGTERLFPHQLSGGMRQRASLLRTYIASNGVALLDEPFSALDTITKGKIHAWFLDVLEQIQLSVLFITHDIDEAILLSDRIYILSGSPGKIVKEFAIQEPKPRRTEFNLSDEFMAYKREIVGALGI